MKALNWVNKFSAVRTRACGADCTLSVWAAGSRANKSTGKENGRAHARRRCDLWRQSEEHEQIQTASPDNTLHADAEDEEFWKTPMAWRNSIQSENACELSVLLHALGMPFPSPACAAPAPNRQATTTDGTDRDRTRQELTGWSFTTAVLD
jgi:hypothetical protein